LGATVVIIRPGRQKKKIAKPLSGRNVARLLMLAFAWTVTPAILKAWLRLSHIHCMTFNHENLLIRH